MRREMLERNIGDRVQLEPAAIHLDALGRELPSRHEDWVIVDVTDDAARLDNATGLTTRIGLDSIHHYTSDPSRPATGGVEYGMLLLTVQMYIQNGNATYRPCPKPGGMVPGIAPASAGAGGLGVGR